MSNTVSISELCESLRGWCGAIDEHAPYEIGAIEQAAKHLTQERDAALAKVAALEAERDGEHPGEAPGGWHTGA